MTVCLFLGTSTLNAAHIIGGDITYRCMTNDRYAITMTIYRDCQGGGAPFDSQNQGAGIQASVTIYRGSETNPFQVLYLDPPTIDRVDPDIDNPCLILPPNVCVQQGVYTFDVVLPESDQSYHIVYQRCCRNNTINNIRQPGSTGATYTIEITPKAQEICNDSPVFNDFPPIVICQDEDVNFDHSATDPDGTSQLVYEFCSPFVGGGLGGANPGDPPGAAFGFNGVAPDPDAFPPFTDVNFVLPTYAYNRPMAGNPVVSIDPNTGMITGVPEILGQYVVGVCVKEYLDGELICVVKRDFQFNVAVCEPTVVADLKADDIVNGNEFVVNSCGNYTVGFTNNSYQAQFIDEYYWEFDLGPGDKKILRTKDAVVTFPGVGTYQGTMILNPGTECSDTALIHVNVYPEVESDFTFDYDTCMAGPVFFEDGSNSPAGPITSYDWNFADGDVDDQINPFHVFDDPGLYPVSLTVTDINQCTAVAVHEVSYYPVPTLLIVEPSQFKGCAPANVTFTNLSQPINDDYTINWTFGDGGTSTRLSPTHQFMNPGIYTIDLEVISPLGCKTSTTFRNWIEIKEAPLADFSYAPNDLTNFNREVIFHDESERAVGWQWDFNGEGKSFIQHPTYHFQDTGLKRVQQVAFHQNGCTDTAIQYIDIVPINTYFLPNAFTPNGDGVNDEYKGNGSLLGMTNFSMTIWNRWGQEIFHSKDPSAGWNGQYQNTGDMSPPGVYICIVSYIGPRGQVVELESFATLVL